MRKYYHLSRSPLVKKIANTLLVTCIDDDKFKPLHIMLPKISASVKSYDGKAKWIYFLIEDDGLLKKNYNNNKAK